MSESFILLMYAISLAFIGVFAAILCVYRYYLGNRLNEQAIKLRNQIASIRRDFPEIGKNPGEFVGNAIENIGIDGLIDSLGLPGFIKPIAKGYLDNLLKNPEKLKDLAKSIGVKLPNEPESNQSNLL